VVGSKRFAWLVTVGAGAVALCALGPMATASANDPNLVCSWTGHRERHMQWSTPEGPLQDDLVGAFTPDGALVAGSDAEGTYSFKLVDSATLDYCYAEHGQGYRTTCARLQKEA
jgi:hypothetical protein